MSSTDSMPERLRQEMARTMGMTEKQKVQRRIDWTNAEVGDSDADDGYNCTICKNKGFIAWMEIDYDADGNEIGWRERISDCKCKKSRAAIQRLKRSGLENLVQDCKFDKYKTDVHEWQKSVKAGAVKFVADPDHNMFFFGGSNGGGKTMLCATIAIHYLRKGSEIVYMSWRDDVEQLNGCVNDAEEYGRLIAQYKEAEVLYIDDFLKITRDKDNQITLPSGGELNRAYEIINYRYRNPKFITIISSERYMQEIIQIDEATGSRIYERTKDGYCFNVKRDPRNNYRLRGMELMG